MGHNALLQKQTREQGNIRQEIAQEQQPTKP